MEADVAAFDDPDDRKADLIDGSIGEASMFHRSFGYYAQGVSQSTAVLPVGWRDDTFATSRRRRTESWRGVSRCTICGWRPAAMSRWSSGSVQTTYGKLESVRVAGDRPDRVRSAR